MRLNIATNQPWIGGGEVMLFNLAEAARDLGHEVSVVSPTGSDVATRARDQKFAAIDINGSGTRGYLTGLRWWATKAREGLLWCNGLRPAFATTGLPNRVVHLHRVPSPAQSVAASVARRGAVMTVVPSSYVADRVSGARLLPNWTKDFAFTPRGELHHPLRVGYLGRIDPDKGWEVLRDAVSQLQAQGHAVEIHLAGISQESGRDSVSDPAIAQHGWVDPADFLPQLDVLVVPSTRAESFGLVAAEAMACGTPVIVSDAGALPEVVGVDHPWVTPANDPHRLANLLVEFFSEDQHPAAALTAARTRWEHHFSPLASKTHLATLLDAISAGQA